jgi:hypothetical protein
VDELYQIFVHNFKATFAIDFSFNMFARLKRTDAGISYEGRVMSRRDLLEIPSEESGGSMEIHPVFHVSLLEPGPPGAPPTPKTEVQRLDL